MSATAASLPRTNSCSPNCHEHNARDAAEPAACGGSDFAAEKGGQLPSDSPVQPQLCGADPACAAGKPLHHGKFFLPAPEAWMAAAQPRLGGAQAGGAAGSLQQHTHAQMSAPSAAPTLAQPWLGRMRPGGAVAPQFQHGNRRCSAPSAAMTIAQPEAGSARPAGAVSSPLQHSDVPLPAPSAEVTIAQGPSDGARPDGAAGPLHRASVQLPAPLAATTRAPPQLDRMRPGGAVAPPLQHGNRPPSAPSAGTVPAQFQGWQYVCDVGNTHARQLNIAHARGRAPANELVNPAASSSWHMLDQKYRTMLKKLLTGQVS